MELADVIRAMREMNERFEARSESGGDDQIIQAHVLAIKALEQAQRELAHHHNTREVLDV